MFPPDNERKDVVNRSLQRRRNPDMQTSKNLKPSTLQVVRFIDLGGHQKYLKTALYGLTSLLPDYVLACICPLTGFTQVTKEHLAVALALKLPVAFVITKVSRICLPAKVSGLA